MRGRVLAQLALVVAGADDLALVDDDGADRDVLVLERALRLAERQAHEPLVASEEAGGRVTPAPYVRVTGYGARLWAPELLCFARAAGPSCAMRRLRFRILLSSLLARSPCRVRAVPPSTPARSSCASAPAGRGALRRRRRGAPRAPGACAGAPGVVARGAALRRARRPDFDDTGVAQAAGAPGGWQPVEWDLVGPFGINVAGAWNAARGASAPRGGEGVTVAVLDTGVAYANRGPVPPLARPPAQRIVRGYDFVADDPYPNDANGHGTFVASAIAAAANNHYGMVGVAYGARIMPVRVLDSLGDGQLGRHRRGHPLRRRPRRPGHQRLDRALRRCSAAGPPITSSPEIREALRYAREHRVPVVVAAGNAGEALVPSTRLDDTSSTSARRPSTAAWPTTRTPARASTSSRPAAAPTPRSRRPELHARRADGRNVPQVTFNARRSIGAFRVPHDDHGQIGWRAPRWPPRT